MHYTATGYLGSTIAPELVRLSPVGKYLDFVMVSREVDAYRLLGRRPSVVTPKSLWRAPPRRRHLRLLVRARLALIRKI